MMKIKRISILLILLALAQALSACGKNPTTKNKDPKPAIQTSKAQEVNNTKPTGKLKITIMDVKHGDAILLQTNGKNYLIDTGHEKNRNDYVANMEKLGVNQVDTMLITHHHRDHMGNALWSAGRYKVHRIWDTGIVNEGYKSSLKLDDILRKGNYRNRVLKSGDVFKLDDKLSFEVLSPGNFLPSFANNEINNKSLVMKMHFGDFTMLFTGDIEEPCENVLTNVYGKKLKADVIKVPHHGSKSSSSANFVSCVKPKYALISCGNPEKYKHPSPKVVNAWEKQGAKVYSTLDNGNLTVLTDGKKFSVSVEK